MKKKFLIRGSILSLLACSTQPQKIEYGIDVCHFCKMTIVDKIHAAEIVTRKGKAFKFDAMECMLDFGKNIESKTIARYLTNHYDKPEELVDATKAVYLISKNVPSPMGAFLTAFRSEESAVFVRSKKGGQLYSWKELLKIDKLRDN